MKKEYEQMCVWPGTIVGETEKERSEFVSFMKKEFGVRVKYVEEIETAPDYKDGYAVKGTGGRNDLFFLIHNDDIPKFAVARLQFGIRWLEDVLNNENGLKSLYPQRIVEYRTW